MFTGYLANFWIRQIADPTYAYVNTFAYIDTFQLPI